jgi:uracil-DNA glycosylase
MFDLEKIAPDWMPSFDKLKTQKTWTDLDLFVAGERLRSPVYPPHEDVFRAFAETSLTDTKAVLLGQDPYHNENQAHGLAFSVSRGQKLPPSLQNILKELDTDLGIDVGKCGDLTKWARQGVLLLNTVLTVRAHEPGSHRKHL